jgi:hypothetical protein
MKAKKATVIAFTGIETTERKIGIEDVTSY